MNELNYNTMKEIIKRSVESHKEPKHLKYAELSCTTQPEKMRLHGETIEGKPLTVIVNSAEMHEFHTEFISTMGTIVEAPNTAITYIMDVGELVEMILENVNLPSNFTWEDLE